MFVDQVRIVCLGGNGGAGCCSFRREAHVPRGGPDGGDGGRGGHVILEVDENITSLVHLLGIHEFRAEDGRPGQGALKSGRQGVDLVIRVPPGTLVFDTQRQFVLKDLTEHGTRIVIAHGGQGGKGNARFVSSTNRAPRETTPGEEGERRDITLVLKVVADVGLIGKPNAGKSTLLSRLSRATPQIAPYPFTTKHPNVGIVRAGSDRQFVMADIPGLIEGAHAGVGLGHEFLRHVERCRLLVHLIEPQPLDGSDPVENYGAIRQELKQYDEELASRPEIVVVTKCELPDAAAAAELLQEYLQREVLQVSAVTGRGLPALIQRIVQELDHLGPVSPLPRAPFQGVPDSKTENPEL
ncbi:MAG: GTPase Obg [Planctomycetaceae bacterium]|nr:MAG: GTPase Obg [Planctomycetaceae bacterium]